jgi:nitrate reductase delta subunit
MADLLEYPGPETVGKARRCAQLLRAERPGAAERLGEFIGFMESEPEGRLEETYTVTFDLNPQCYPYAGFQLFGEDPKRSALMAGLQHQYCLSGFQTSGELPDHVPTLLRFLCELQDEEARRELAEMVIVPALDKMASTLESKSNPYAKAVIATKMVMSTSDELASEVAGE